MQGGGGMRPASGACCGTRPDSECSSGAILSSRENPKICGIDDAEVVGDLIAVDMPIPRHLLAQKSQYRAFEILEPIVAFVVSAMPVHQSPQSFDRVQMWAVGRDEVQPNPASRPCQPLLPQLRMMISGFVEKYMDKPLARIHRLNR